MAADGAPSVSAEDCKGALAKLDNRFQTVIRTHEAELRFHLLGQKDGPDRAGGSGHQATDGGLAIAPLAD